ncbi:DeoR/GlpR family DNA-binding transcription regulator [Streptosporangium amethystogenes]|uniref:DeoR/GlpR family DNA-binding transcription regulator n=1 Tax=Streptosporangium TaxID=2000 RepID=UPI00343E97F4
MLAAERHDRILTLLAPTGHARTEELARSLGVSDETIRRDLSALERQGVLVRVHGGATLRAPIAGEEASFLDRATLATEEKVAIGRSAASLVRPGMTVMIDVGTTSLEVARSLPNDYHGTVVTCSLLVASELAGRARIEVLVSGGRVRAGDLALSNSTTLGFFQDLRPDIAFLGSGGVSTDAGLTDFHVDEVATKRAVLATSARSYVLADSTKHGRVAAFRVCDLDGFTGLIAGEMTDEALAEALRNAGCHVVTGNDLSARP